MKVITDTLGVARSNLIEQSGTPRSKTGRRFRRGDEGLLALIKPVIDARTSYGYRQVTALVNQTLLQAGQPRINGKRVHRTMQMNNLTLELHTARRPGRTHEGVVIALKSNIRWCSDHFEVHCRDGAIVRVPFAIDACDRGIIPLSAIAGGGISVKMVRDMMIICVERRFGKTKTIHPVEWLSDNSSAYIAADKADTASALGLKLAFTPVRSPESNGISKIFVKTSRRKYLRNNILTDAETLLNLLPSWFNDYNEVQPHSGSSPRESSVDVVLN